MAWRIELSPHAHKGLKGLDPGLVRRLLKFLHDRIAPLEDPRCLGEALKGSKLGEFWKYRVGDFRLICRIEDDRLLILVVQIGNRREIYR
jgi:mRNA interferase RelE/StbE